SYRVRAYNSAGDSAYSNTATATTGSAAPTLPPAPTGVSATDLTSTRVSLSWSSVGSSATGYRVERRTELASTWTPISNVGAGTVSFVDTGLTPDTTYTYRV